MTALSASAAVIGQRLRVRGQVHGVSFRPHVRRLAMECALTGRVLNDSAGVVIDLWGAKQDLVRFIDALRSDVPPLARIDSVEYEALTGMPPSDFPIDPSADGRPETGIVPDAAACPQCVAETLDPFARRYRYPFTNCTHCGPRFSIARAIPYDRANTTMDPFVMCGDCAREYGSPGDRRYHAQPIACHACGPAVRLERSDGLPFFQESLSQLDAVDAARGLVLQGRILAIKGTGGFHLVCDAGNADVVDRLRRRKHRERKPFAVMVRDLEVARRYCEVDAVSADLLSHRSAPIVLMPGREDRLLPEAVAPGVGSYGVMLPYMPLHYLLLRGINRPVVMTSGSVGDEPRCIDDDDARRKLSGIADYFLWHDRGIATRLDDSVVRVIAGKPRMLRRARGSAPEPVALPSGFERAPTVLAMGSEINNTFCFLRGGQAVVSQHIGDLAHAAAFEDYRRNIGHYRGLFGCREEVVAVDAHPEYHATVYGRELAGGKLEVETVQHHHAHIAACMADNRMTIDAGRVLGIALDGMGHGADGSQWGGEFLAADYRDFERLGALRPVRLPGGDQAVRQPWRCTYAYLCGTVGWDVFTELASGCELADFLGSQPLETLDAMMASGVNSPLSSSCGRLFDAVAAAVGICRGGVDFEGEAAMLLEAAAQSSIDEYVYPFHVAREDGFRWLDSGPMWMKLIDDLLSGLPTGAIAWRFHRGLGRAMARMAAMIADERGIGVVVLSGGVFQNRALFETVETGLRGRGLEVLSHDRVPSNDGGLSLGQAVVAAARAIEKSD